MPRRTTGLRRRASAGLSPRVVAYLFIGPDSNNLPFSQEEHARPVWDEHEEMLMQWWARGFPDDFDYDSIRFVLLLDKGPKPGRPWAWRKFSAPEPRRLLKVYGSTGERAPTPADVGVAKKYGLGRSRTPSEYATGCGFYFEDDDAYFARLGARRV